MREGSLDSKQKFIYVSVQKDNFESGKNMIQS